MRTIFYDKWYIQALQFEEKIKSKGWIFVDHGKDRRVWKKKNVVLKIAYTESGVAANLQEDLIYHNHKNDHYAPCRLIQDNVLMMVAVLPLDDLDPVQGSRIPDWAYELNDGPQVGMTKSGKVLAYDYGEEQLTNAVGGNHRSIDTGT